MRAPRTQHQTKAPDMVPAQDGLKKDRKQAFVLKSVGPTARSLAGVLSTLRDTLQKSKDGAEEEGLHLLRGDVERYQDKRGKPLPYAHQVDSMPPKDDRENYKDSEIVTSAFLEEHLGPKTSFLY